MDKKALRKEMTRLIGDMSDEQRKNLSVQVSKNLMSRAVWKEARQILLFLSFGKEFETGFLIQKALESGKKLAIPRIYGREMKFHYLQSAEDTMETNQWGIREPLADSQLWSSGRDLTVMLTPGLAFGPGGSRLGRGGGYYDRFLSRYKDELKTVGLAFDCFFREDIPLEEHDIKLNALCTESRFYSF